MTVQPLDDRRDDDAEAPDELLGDVKGKDDGADAGGREESLLDE